MEAVEPVSCRPAGAERQIIGGIYPEKSIGKVARASQRGVIAELLENVLEISQVVAALVTGDNKHFPVAAIHKSLCQRHRPACIRCLEQNQKRVGQIVRIAHRG